MLPLNTNIALEQAKGIEPSLQHWQCRGLPLHHACILVINIHDFGKKSSLIQIILKRLTIQGFYGIVKLI